MKFTTLLATGLIAVSVLHARADGLDQWTPVSQLGDTITAVHFLNENFIALGLKGVYRSLDGVEWGNLPPVPRGITKAISYGNGVFVAAGGTLTATSPDLTNWTVRAVGGVRDLLSVTYGGSQFLLLDAPGTVWAAADGADWRATGGAITNNALTYASGLFLGTGTKAASSPDGIKWTLASTNATGTGGDLALRSAAFGVAGWVGLGTNSGSVWISPDALKWTRVATLQATNLARLTFAAGRYVAAGDRGLIWTSPDGKNWTGRFLPDDSTPKFVAHNGSHFVAVTDDGVVYRSGLVATEGSPANLELDLYPGLRITGAIGSRYDIEATTEVEGITGWAKIGFVVLRGPSMFWVDEEKLTPARRFYRAVEVR
ncbi:MAG: hypothetical protein EXS31_03950 [Pedosphaera sp.]|nr:hypothetical protein [Pedosphaera sp.]